jgi:hypothetical protein
VKIFVSSKKVLTFASAFAQKLGHEQIKKSSLKDLHKQTSSTRSELPLLAAWVIERTVKFSFI